jgi:hypothetical protein
MINEALANCQVLIFSDISIRERIKDLILIRLGLGNIVSDDKRAKTSWQFRTLYFSRQATYIHESDAQESYRQN